MKKGVAFTSPSPHYKVNDWKVPCQDPCDQRADSHAFAFDSCIRSFTNVRSFFTTKNISSSHTEWNGSYPTSRRTTIKRSQPTERPALDSPGPLRLEIGRDIFKPYHHDRDVVVRVSMCGLLNQQFRSLLGIRNAPYELTGCLVF